MLSGHWNNRTFFTGKVHEGISDQDIVIALFLHRCDNIRTSIFSTPPKFSETHVVNHFLDVKHVIELLRDKSVEPDPMLNLFIRRRREEQEEFVQQALVPPPHYDILRCPSVIGHKQVQSQVILTVEESDNACFESIIALMLAIFLTNAFERRTDSVEQQDLDERTVDVSRFTADSTLDYRQTRRLVEDVVGLETLNNMLAKRMRTMMKQTGDMAAISDGSATTHY